MRDARPLDLRRKKKKKYTAGQPRQQLSRLAEGRQGAAEGGAGGRQGGKVKASQAARSRQGEEQVKARSRVTDRTTPVNVSAPWTRRRA